MNARVQVFPYNLNVPKINVYEGVSLKLVA